MILPTKGMIFRKKNGGDKEPTNTRTYKSFFLEKSLKVSLLVAKTAVCCWYVAVCKNETFLFILQKVS